MAKRGKPAFQATQVRRRDVAEMASCGMSEDDIARALGCSTPTLQKYFQEELLTGRAKKRMLVIRGLYKAAATGNVAALKKLEDMTGIAATARPPTPIERSSAKPGKKEQAKADAANPDTSTDMGDLMARRAEASKVH